MIAFFVVCISLQGMVVSEVIVLDLVSLFIVEIPSGPWYMLWIMMDVLEGIMIKQTT